MFATIRRVLAYRLFPLAFSIFTIILLCIPGSLVQGTGIFGIKHFDKVIHVIIFGMNALFWGWHFNSTGRPAARMRTIYVMVGVAVTILGIIMEFVQMYFVPNRFFDQADIVADAAGAGLATLWLLYK